LGGGSGHEVMIPLPGFNVRFCCGMDDVLLF